MLKRFYSNPIAALFISIVVISLGILRFLELPVALYPSTSKPELWLTFYNAPGTVDSFRKKYGNDIEQKIESINQVDSIESEYRSGRARFMVQFEWNTSIDDAKSKLENAIGEIVNRMPKGNDQYWIWTEGAQGSRIYISITSPKRTIDELYKKAENRIGSPLKRLDGVERVWIARPNELEIEIEVNPTLILQYGISPSTIIRAIRERETDLGLGKLDLQKQGGPQYDIRIAIKPDRVKDLELIPIKETPNRIIYLKDIAKVALEHKPPEEIFRGNGLDSLFIAVSPDPEANIADVAKSSIAIVEEKAAAIGDDLDVEIMTDPSLFIQEAIRNIVFAVIVGMIVAMITLFLFLGSLRNSTVIGISIPLSLCGGIIMMSLMGIELNLISLGAMSLAVGMVVDGSIVVFENIVRKLEEAKGQLSFSERLGVVYRSVLEVRSAVISSVLTTIIVFFPLYFTSPLAAAILGDLALVIVFVMSLSILVTLFIVPPITLLLRVGEKKEDSEENDHKRRKGVYIFSFLFWQFFNWLKRFYLTVLKLVLANRIVASFSILAIISAMGFAGYLLTNSVKREIMGVPDTDKLLLIIRSKDKSFSNDQMLAYTKEYEKQVNANFSEYIHNYTSIIQDNRITMILALKDKKQIKEFREKMDQKFSNTASLRVFTWPWNPTSLKIPNPPLVHISVDSGSDAKNREILGYLDDALSGDRTGRMRNWPRIKQDDLYELKVDWPKVYELQKNTRGRFNIDNLAEVVKLSINKKFVTDLDFDDETIPVQLQYPEDYIQSATDISNFIVKAGDQYLPLRHILEVVPTRDWQDKFYRDGQPVYQIKAYIKDSAKDQKAEVRAELIAKVKGDQRIDQSAIEFLDADIEINDNISSLVRALVIALFLITTVILLQFGSLIQTIVVLAAIPLGFIGVGISLYVFESSLSVNSMLGLILLCGTAVNNSILFVDFYNQLAGADKENRSKLDLLIQTASLRFRPIMITTCTTVLGMLPIAVGFGSGGEILQPLGIAVCGGLGISTFLTVLIIPLMLKFCPKPVGLEEPSTSKIEMKPSTASALVVLVLMATSMIPQDLSASVKDELSNLISARLSIDSDVANSKRQLESIQLVQKGKKNLLPSANFSRSYNETEDIGNSDKRKSANFNLRVSKSFDNVLNKFHEISKSDADIALAELQLKMKTQAVHSEVKKLFLTFLAASSQKEISKSNMNLTKQFFEIVKNRFSKGLENRSGMLRVELRKNNSESNYLLNEKKFEQAKNNLCQYVFDQTQESTNQNHSNSICFDKNYSDGLELFSLSDLKSTLENVKSYTLQQYLPFQLARIKHQANQYEFSSQRYPNLTFNVSATHSRSNFEAEGTNQILLEAGIELFNYDKDIEKRRLKLAELSSESTKIASKQNFSKNQRNRLLSLEESLLQIESQDQEAKTWQEIISMSRNRFEQGQGSSRDVTEDLLESLRAKTRLLTSKKQFLETVFTWEQNFSGSRLFLK